MIAISELQRRRKVRVLIVDDSAVVRQWLTRELSRDGDIEVVGTAPDPYVARDKILEFQPDVLTLDVEMPRMDGITFLRKLMASHPMPVVVLSSLTAQGTRSALDALAAGAVAVLSKSSSAHAVGQEGSALAARIKEAARAHVRKLSAGEAIGPGGVQKRVPVAQSLSATTDKILAIGASTGGVQALTEVLATFPPNAPGTIIVQHMPAHFTASFAERLNTMCHVEVKEAADGDGVIQGTVLIAPGGFHTVLRRSGSRYYVQVKDGPEVHHQKPSVDVLFNSVARYAGANAVGAILTGMGADGAQGLLAMRQAGARTIAQDEKSSIVYGMPMEAAKCGAAEEVLPLDLVTSALIRLANAPTR